MLEAKCWRPSIGAVILHLGNRRAGGWHEMRGATLTDHEIFTQAVHAGEREPAPEGRPVSTPIYPAITYIHSDMRVLSDVLGFEHRDYCYARYGSPTIAALEKAIAALEGAADAVAFSSGMAALHLALLQAGITHEAPVVAASDLYGATRTLLKQLLAPGAPLRLVDITDLNAVRDAIQEVRPRAVLLEIMSNPLLKIADLPAIAESAHQTGAAVIVDSTFTTPFLMQPLKWGADVVVHSATKYLGGHGDVMGGAVATDAARAGGLRELLKTFGSNLGPFEAWTVLRGIKTLPLRMREQCGNAMKIALWLCENPRVTNVWYPGLTEHPQHQLTQRLFRSGYFGGMVAFELRDAGQAEVYRFMEALKLVQTGTSLGDVYSLILYPAMASHRALTREERYRIGITDGVLRLSAGI
jgi:cystathionine gamma-synthase/methionine-gamma-lyase